MRRIEKRIWEKDKGRQESKEDGGKGGMRVGTARDAWEREKEASSTDLHCKKREYCFTETDTQTHIQ